MIYLYNRTSHNDEPTTAPSHTDESHKIMLSENSQSIQNKWFHLYKVEKAGKTKLPNLGATLGRKVRKWWWYRKSQGRGLPRWLSGKEPAYQCRRHGSNPWSRKSPHALGQPSPCPQLLSLRSRPHELQLLKPTHPRASALQ